MGIVEAELIRGADLVDLHEAESLIREEINRQTALIQSAQQMATLQGQYLDARDGKQPTPGPDAAPSDWPEWTQPLGAHDSYPKGRIVRFEGKLWQSNLPFANPHKPGVENGGWVDVTDALTGEVSPPAVKTEPWSVYTSYVAGQAVTYLGVVFWCVQGHTSIEGWEPPNTPALWTTAQT